MLVMHVSSMAMLQKSILIGVVHLNLVQIFLEYGPLMTVLLLNHIIWGWTRTILSSATSSRLGLQSVVAQGTLSRLLQPLYQKDSVDQHRHYFQTIMQVIPVPRALVTQIEVQPKTSVLKKEVNGAHTNVQTPTTFGLQWEVRAGQILHISRNRGLRDVVRKSLCPHSVLLIRTSWVAFEQVILALTAWEMLFLEWKNLTVRRRVVLGILTLVRKLITTGLQLAVKIGNMDLYFHPCLNRNVAQENPSMELYQLVMLQIVGIRNYLTMVTK
mmetsp:Transcript_6959/g.10555  ORF Transcript_6959/g.10555 Transcript_6959/m.10555 type:complete len:271 (-) Transcript_6959:1619-2431(-)